MDKYNSSIYEYNILKSKASENYLDIKYTINKNYKSNENALINEIMILISKYGKENTIKVLMEEYGLTATNKIIDMVVDELNRASKELRDMAKDLKKSKINDLTNKIQRK